MTSQTYARKPSARYDHPGPWLSHGHDRTGPPVANDRRVRSTAMQGITYC